jgi:uncharacterized membrane protein YkoI
MRGRFEVAGFGSVKAVRLASTRPGRVEVVLEMARTEGVVEALAELSDKVVPVTVELRSLQQEMGMAVDRQTGEILGGVGGE